MRQIFGLFFLFLIVACGDKTQTSNKTNIGTVAKVTDTIKQQTSSTIFNQYAIDSSYEISKQHTPFMVTGYLNFDDVLDTAILIRHKSTGKDALFIKHGSTDKVFLLKKGKDVGTDFSDFNWVGQFQLVQKGTKIWNNVIDGEIVSEDQVPENSKIILTTDGIFLHLDEGSGGGIIYYKNGKYVWVQQD